MTVFTSKGLIQRAFIGRADSGWVLWDHNNKEVLKTFKDDLECFDYVYPETIRYHRNPTKTEVKLGYGAVHYRDFSPLECAKPNGALKKWFIAGDGLRYYK